MNHAIMIHIKAKSKLSIEPCGKRKYMMHIIIKRFESFHIMLEIRENSIFILACIRARTEEFRSPKIVKMEIIKMDMRASIELYPGRK